MTRYVASSAYRHLAFSGPYPTGEDQIQTINITLIALDRPGKLSADVPSVNVCSCNGLLLAPVEGALLPIPPLPERGSQDVLVQANLHARNSRWRCNHFIQVSEPKPLEKTGSHALVLNPRGERQKLLAHQIDLYAPGTLLDRKEDEECRRWHWAKVVEGVRTLKQSKRLQQLPI